MKNRSALAQLPRLALLILWLTACTSVPFDYPKQASYSIPASADTDYGRRLAAWRQREGEEYSGFVPLIQGIDALGARLAMIENAQATIDAQYFLIKPDQAGELFLGGLLRAADRGVRVRLLIDDIFTPRNDTILAVFSSHPNIEVRLFNPVSRASPTAWSFLWSFSRVNRRMHNKAFVVDGSIAIMGGRNIAEEYFDLKPQQDFDDFEVLLFGEVVPEIATSFDSFWNSSLAVPMEAIRVSDKPERVQRWLDHTEKVISGAQPSPYSAAINSAFVQRVLAGDVTPYIATADVVYDPPDKLLNPRDDPDYRVLANRVAELFQQSQEEILAITPYMVPSDRSYPLLAQARDRGVQTVIVTNSLASTNHVAVHSGYAPRRKGMLEAGAEIWEIKVNKNAGEADSDKDLDRVTLHTKAIVFDREQLFVGSLNFDPRSIEINTEVGLFIHSPAAAGDFSNLVFAELPRYAYRLQLNEEGELRWHYDYAGQHVVYDREPDTGVGRRFKAGFYGLLPLDSQL